MSRSTYMVNGVVVSREEYMSEKAKTDAEMKAFRDNMNNPADSVYEKSSALSNPWERPSTTTNVSAPTTNIQNTTNEAAPIPSATNRDGTAGKYGGTRWPGER